MITDLIIFLENQDSGFIVGLGSLSTICIYSIYKVIRRACKSVKCVKIEFSNWKIELDKKV